jgi:hypothetical protein
MAYVVPAVPSRRAEMWFDGPSQQRRWTVLLRLILVIPQYVVLLIIAVAYLVVVIIGWFAALVLGRLPDWAHVFLTGFVRWQTRVGAYFYLLTDQYPPFSFEDEDYPVRPVLPPSGRLNRWAVLFRLILIIPAAFFGTIVAYGLVAPLLLVTWLIVLVGGEMPGALYWAYSALLRYQMRFQAFFAMLTPVYAWGMLGDRAPNTFGYPPPTPPFAWPGDAIPPEPPAAPTGPQTAFSAPVVSEAPSPSTLPRPATEPATSMDQPDATAMPEPSADELGQAAGSVPPPSVAAWSTTAPPQPPAYWPPPSPPTSIGSGMPPPSPPPPVVTPDRGWLILPRAARGWLIFAIVWGAILFAAQTTINSITATNNLNRIQGEYNTVVNDFNDQKSAVDNAISVSQHCITILCLRPSHRAAAASLQRFASDVRAMNLPSGAQQPAQLVESDASQLASAFSQLANSANGQAYKSTVQSSQINTLLRTLPNDTNSLLAALNHAFECPASNGLTFCSSS